MNTCENKNCKGVTNDCADCLQIIVNVHKARIAKLRTEAGQIPQIDVVDALLRIKDAIHRLTDEVIDK